MSDTLRTRIAAELYRQHYRYGNPNDITWDELETDLKDRYLADADAVIRELDLTQQYLVDGIISDGEPRPWELPCETRYATEWEPFHG